MLLHATSFAYSDCCVKILCYSNNSKLLITISNNKTCINKTIIKVYITMVLSLYLLIIKAVKFHCIEAKAKWRRFADDTFKCIFLNENVIISMKIPLKFVPKAPIINNPALVQIMAWHQSGDKPLSEPMMVSLLTYICVTRPQWVNI